MIKINPVNSKELIFGYKIEGSTAKPEVFLQIEIKKGIYFTIKGKTMKKNEAFFNIPPLRPLLNIEFNTSYPIKVLAFVEDIRYEVWSDNLFISDSVKICVNLVEPEGT